MRDHLHRVACRLARAGTQGLSSPDALSEAANSARIGSETRGQLLQSVSGYLANPQAETSSNWLTIVSLASEEIALRQHIASKPAVPRFFAWLNYLPVFDAFRWPKRELVSRILAFIIVGAFVTRKVIDFKDFPGMFEPVRDYFLGLGITADAAKLMWGLRLSVWSFESGILVGYLIAYLLRKPAKGVARGFMEVVYPFIIAGAPIIMAMAPVNYRPTAAWLALKLDTLHYPTEFWMLIGIFSIMTLGGAINLVGLLYLRRAFTIMAEARELIKSGIFGLVRHPLYAGHFVLFLGSLMLRLHWYTIPMYALFVVGQVYRARIEERKLASVFPEYADYKASTGMFFPKLFRRRTQ